MSFENIRKIPSVEEILTEIPMPQELKDLKARRDQELRNILENKDPRFLLIIGPCSADNEDAVCEYIGRLGRLQDKVKDRLFLIPRIYTNKPRTTGLGYKGMAHQPDPMEEPNIVVGLKAIRRMHIRAIKESGLTAADEMLYASNYPYLEDILSYVAIGARSVENQKHRLTVSGLDIPVGMKNPTSGDIGVMLNAIQAAQNPHIFIYNGWEVKTSGNPWTHAILRGAQTPHGNSVSNYHYEDLMEVTEAYLKRGFSHPAIIVDTNHCNSGKKYQDQPRIALEVVQSMQKSGELKKIVKGLMIESYLEEGTQEVGGGVYGKSITDACLGWADSEKLVLDLAEDVGKL